MANLKDLKLRIVSVKSTQKITKAMKMVAAAKLRRAQERAKASEPYAERMARVLSSLATNVSGNNAPLLLAGRSKEDIHLVIVATSDRGLCGGFNTSIVKEARRRIAVLDRQGKQVKLLCIGSKGYDQLKSVYGNRIIGKIDGLGKKPLAYEQAEKIAHDIVTRFGREEFDACSIIYNTFKSAISQEVTVQQLIPLELDSNTTSSSSNTGSVYEFEPSEGRILEALLPRNLAIQILRALLQNAASEQGARMTAMDNATRNAGDMIKKLTLVYNRTRQAAITKELIEIISGAEAL